MRLVYGLTTVLEVKYNDIYDIIKHFNYPCDMISDFFFENETTLRRPSIDINFVYIIRNRYNRSMVSDCFSFPLHFRPGRVK